MYDLRLVCHIETQTETKCPNLIIKHPTLLHIIQTNKVFFLLVFIIHSKLHISNSQLILELRKIQFQTLSLGADSVLF